MSEIAIRPIESFSELRAVEDLQKDVWGTPDLDVVPLTHLVATIAAGGVLLGAFDGATLVGFVYGFVGKEEGQITHHSHMLAVKPAYRDLNLGYKLKLAQREAVLAQGINVITWTFDPLQSLNAYFNFKKLRVVAERYLVNFYGEEAPSFLHRSGTDRLWVKWLINSDRVVQRIDKSPVPPEVPIIKPMIEVAPDNTPIELSHDYSSNQLSIEIPNDINTLQGQTPEVAVAWRETTRQAFRKAIDARYQVVEFYRIDRNEQKIGVYLLSHILSR
jgi:predicted GNAT superfamily acetyltransferase